MPVTKEFKTIEEQIAGLENRNLKFKNKEKAATSKAPTNMCQSFWARKPLIPTPTGKALGEVVTIQQIIRFRGVS